MFKAKGDNTIGDGEESVFVEGKEIKWKPKRRGAVHLRVFRRADTAQGAMAHIWSIARQSGGITKTRTIKELHSIEEE